MCVLCVCVCVCVCVCMCVCVCDLLLLEVILERSHSVSGFSCSVIVHSGWSIVTMATQT